MSYTRLPWRVHQITSRTHLEAYAGLFLLVLGLTALTFGHCPQSNESQRPRPLGMSLRVSGEKMPPSVVYGNALNDGKSRKGWWVGHFMQPVSPRYSSHVETKWIAHPKGRSHEVFSTNKVATSMAVLISGKHRIEFEKSHVVLEYPGDYVIWGPGVAHSWSAMEDSTMLCIRWPSIGGDQLHSSVDVSNRNGNVGLLNKRSAVDPRLATAGSRNTSRGLNERPGRI